jgi:transcriptional regulator with XRE-family HTH domain
MTNRLRVLRAEHRLTQLDLAAQAGIAENRYWRIENLYAEPTLDEQNALAGVFGVRRRDVFPPTRKATRQEADATLGGARLGADAAE